MKRISRREERAMIVCQMANSPPNSKRSVSVPIVAAAAAAICVLLIEKICRTDGQMENDFLYMLQFYALHGD